MGCTDTGFSNPETPKERPARWLVLEVFGHRQIAGRLVSGEPPFSQGVVLDIPLADGTFAQEFYGHGALFGARFVTEALARRSAAQSYHVATTYQMALPPAQEEQPRPRIEPAEEPGGVLAEIRALVDERDEEADDALDEPQWEKLIVESLRLVANDRRDRLLHAAALAVAAIEAEDRRDDLLDLDGDEDDDAVEGDF